MILLAWDPGLDIAGWAAYDTVRLGAGGTLDERAGPALVAHGAIRSTLHLTLGARLEELFSQALAVGHGFSTQRWVIERPAKKAVYHRNEVWGAAPLHDSLLVCAMAAGTIGAAARMLDCGPVEYLRAGQTPKQRKQAIARRILTASACADRSNADVRDAVFLGAEVLLARRAG